MRGIAIAARLAARSHRAIVGALRRHALAVLSETLGRPPATALLDFPAYPNPGDAAIWLGTLRALAALGLPSPSYRTEARCHREDDLARALGRDGTVLLAGGGSFGDVWPEREAFRERVLASTRDRPLVQLPQSLHFETEEALARARAVVSGHPTLRLLVRDEPSRRAAVEDLGFGAPLCPDLALFLDLRPAPLDVPARILWLARDDAEARILPPRDAADVVVRDWADATRTPGYRRLSRRSRRLRRRLDPPRALRARLEATYEPVARERVRAAERVLDGARVVVTDRLHGHLFCLLRGQPHVILDGRTSKLSAFHATWTRDAPGVQLATSADEALGRAREALSYPGWRRPEDRRTGEGR